MGWVKKTRRATGGRSAAEREMMCQRCAAQRAQFQVNSEILSMAVCAACAAEARELGLGVKRLENGRAESNG